jgi:hypothetical protein
MEPINDFRRTGARPLGIDIPATRIEQIPHTFSSIEIPPYCRRNLLLDNRFQIIPGDMLDKNDANTTHKIKT